MVKIFIPPNDIKDLRYLPVLYPNLGVLINEKKLFADLGNRSMRYPVVEITQEVKDADFVLLPYEYFDVEKKYPKYLEDCVAVAQENRKKLLIFDLSDYTDQEINVPYSWVFRIAGYVHRKKDNEIIMPFFVEDLAAYKKWQPRHKNGVPTVGFCGWAGFKSRTGQLKSLVKNLILDIKNVVVFDHNLDARKQGIYFRRKAIAALKKNVNITCNFIIRHSYSSHINTIEEKPEKLRAEYIENIAGSDFALAVRGDANASCRFYEILSMGRIPLFIDTDCVLPLQNEIDYKKIAILVDRRRIDKIGDVVAEFYRNLSDEEFIAMQKSARKVFEEYLCADSFLNYVLSKLIDRQI